MILTREKTTKVWLPVNHKTYHKQCGMIQLCYLDVLSKFVIYLGFYLVLSFLLHYLLLFKSKDGTFMAVKKSCDDYIFFTLRSCLFAKRCFLSTLEEVKVSNFF